MDKRRCRLIQDSLHVLSRGLAVTNLGWNLFSGNHESRSLWDMWIKVLPVFHFSGLQPQIKRLMTSQPRFRRWLPGGKIRDVNRQPDSYKLNLVDGWRVKRIVLTPAPTSNQSIALGPRAKSLSKEEMVSSQKTKRRFWKRCKIMPGNGLSSQELKCKSPRAMKLSANIWRFDLWRLSVNHNCKLKDKGVISKENEQLSLENWLITGQISLQ